MLRIGWKGCPYSGDHEVYRRGWIECLWSSFCNWSGATSASTVTIVLGSFPRRNPPTPIRGEKRAQAHTNDEKRERSA